MDIRFDQEKDVIIVTLHGKLESTNVENLKFELDQYVDVSELKVLFDLQYLIYISSEGMQLLQGLVKNLRDNHGEVLFCNVPDPVREAFDIVGFNQMMKIIDSREEALSLLSGLEY